MVSLALAACQPKPQPFAPTVAERSNPLLKLPDHAGVVVLDIDGAPEQTASRLPQAMIEALLARNIPAWPISGNRASYFLQGGTTAISLGRDRVQITLDWDLVDPTGRQVGRHSLSLKTRWKDWRAGSTDMINALATKSAAGIAAFMQDDAPEDTAARIKRIPLYVTAVVGAPGDGKNSLRLAMAAALRRAKLKIINQKNDRAIEISGMVRIDPARNNQQNIEITWSVRAPDGKEIGKLTQRNTIPAGSLDKAWGETAFMIAEAAIGGVIDLLEIPAAK
jgi:hypothetical protein